MSSATKLDGSLSSGWPGRIFLESRNGHADRDNSNGIGISLVKDCAQTLKKQYIIFKFNDKLVELSRGGISSVQTLKQP